MPEFVEWMMGFPEGWTDVEGVPRTKRLMMLGNAVQVQCAVLVGEWLSDVALTHRGPPNGRPRT